MLANKGAKGNAGHQRDRQATEHNSDGRGCFLFCHQAGGDCRANREEHAVCQTGQQARQDQRFIARGLPGQHITRRKQDHQRQQQLFTRHTPGQRRQYRGADRHAQRVDRDQQSRRRQGDRELLSNGRDQADNHKFSGANCEGTDG